MSRIEAMLDLFLAAAAPAWIADGPVVGVHSGQHSFPLLDQACTLAWLQRGTPLLADFRASPTGLPAPRLRYALPDALEPAVEVLSRASLALLALPESSTVVETERDTALGLALAPVLRSGGGREWLVYGAAASPAWSRGWVSTLLPQLRALAAPPGLRIAASPGVLAALNTLGWALALPPPEALRRAVAALPPRFGAHFEAGTPPARPRLRVRPAAVSSIASNAEATRLLIGVRNKALFGPRGSASLLLPWEACASARLLISNIRGRIDGLLVALGERELVPGKISYTPHGAMVQLEFGPPLPAAGRWLHLGLPRSAWPPQGCCELNAVEFTAELG